ncbi:TPA: CCA tRNA nucleotidyltransferase [Campylobacter fetus subsp. venerealis]|uniref:CCA tRNA nucleotidyltransferase n=3 Tax=Campylobacter fetus TaxID=196 RepID=A0A5L4XFV9_CAMFE|nr:MULTISPECIES: CCA tRNA nucleotidyltransferase [Campylobacter]OCS23208.1 poly(A) polymerase [Campylobacter fetus subsp. venerealis cfvi97/532]OCS26743.1 poly(A) polymerase [Campylobacter fetus subsp. venerealis cfvB10]OCS30575.1 poly(A) polymerase [Campylobacter fetus subsp. venerealis LMG 6570 = CCUG 33900]ABK82654.1 polyA polymerase family protein [Campylobacter fetus subsp. fetus 82-40]AHE94061.1 multifunctional tRNA nucleotidyl transferase / 2'3'-cyclic phosphodiesterase / 2' nucleotidas
MQISNIVSQIFQNNELSTLKNILKHRTKRAYLVGGCVRDMLLGAKNIDFDIEVYDIDPFKFENIMHDIGATGVGKSYFVYKYKNYDISLPRTESKNGIGHKAFIVSYCNDEKIASKRRDFTMNAMMINIFNGEILDFWGGRKDIQNKILKIVDKHSFCEDSLRVLRAVQFAARFGLKADEQSLKIMRNISIDDLSKDRIRSELEKFFIAPHKTFGIELLSDLGLDKRLFGVKFEPDSFGKIVQQHFNITHDSRSFLYDLINFYKLNPKEILDSLSLGKFYKKLINEPFLKRASRYEMMKIALSMPLSNWLGLNTKNRVRMAVDLGFYDKTFNPNIDISKLSHLRGKDLGEHLKVLKELEIKAFLKDKR